MRSAVQRVWGALTAIADRRGAALLALVAIGVHASESTGWPVRAGRDFTSYIGVYDQLWDWHAVLPWSMLQRPPIAPLVIGGTLDLAGGWGAEIVLALLFAASVVAWAVAARVAGAGAAVATGVALVLHPGYGELFHEWSGDAVFAAAFAFWAPILAVAVTRPSLGRFLAVGLGVAVLSLVRPGNQALALVALVPLAVAAPLSRRAGWVAATAAAAIVPLVGWASLNAVRYDDFTVARGANSSFPMFRAFVNDRIVAPDNGPASRRLAGLVRRELLPLEPYRSREIDVDQFFSSGSPRMHEDLVAMSDRVLGWDTDYALLGQVAREAVKAHLGTYARGVGRDLLDALTQPLYGPTTREERASAPRSGRSEAPSELPDPATGQSIPAANQGAYLGTPENRIREVWTSATEHFVVFRRPGDEERADAVAATVIRIQRSLPTHGRSTDAARWLDRASRAYPPALAFLAIGIVAGLWRRPRAWRACAALSAAALLVLTVTLLILSFVAQYGMPLVPAFVLLAAVGLLGERRSDHGHLAPGARLYAR